MKPSPKARATNGVAPRRKSTRSRPSESPYSETLLETFATNSRFVTFNAAISTAGLAALLGGTGPITIFAPTDRAFQKLSSTDRASLLADPAKLAELVRHHVVSGRVKAPQISTPRTVTPEFGDDLRLTASAGGFHVDEARIVKTNIRATNGVIHAIDSVLDPAAEA